MKELLTGDMQLVRRVNRLAILQLIRERGPVSRAELARISRLSSATAFSIVDELEKTSIICQKGIGSSEGGRRPVLFEFNPGAYGALGIDLRSGQLIAAVTDLGARPLSRLIQPVQGELQSQAAAHMIREIALEAIQASGLPSNRIVGMGVSLPGLIDLEGSMVIRAVNLGWEQVNLREMIGDVDGLPIHILDVSMALALGEAYFGAGRGMENLICINVGEGIGSGILINGNLIRGSDGVAGEIGHMTVDEDGPQCRCGNYGCLERLAAGPAILDRTLKGLKQGAVSTIHQQVGGRLEDVTLLTVVEAAQSGDEFAKGILVDTGRYLGLGIANVVNLLNPQMVIVGGEVSQAAGELLLEPLRQAINFRAFEVHARRARVVPASLGLDSSAIGAATFAMIEAGYLATHAPALAGVP